MKQPSGGADSAALLQQIQQQMQEICLPHYDEFYKVTTERGFTKITIPKARHRSVSKQGAA